MLVKAFWSIVSPQERETSPGILEQEQELQRVPGSVIPEITTIPVEQSPLAEVWVTE